MILAIALALVTAAASTTSAAVPLAPARLDPVDVAVLVALHRRLDADGAAGCLNPAVDSADIDDTDRLTARDTLREAGDRHPSRAAIAAAIRDDVRGSWGDVATNPLDPAIEASAVDAYAAAAMRAPRTTRPAMLLSAPVPSDIVLRSDCYARLSRPTIHREWAFVGHVSASAGHLYALRRDGGVWRVIAHRFTAIA